MRFLPMTTFVAALALPAALQAETVAFDKSWQEQKFALFSSNDYSLGGRALGVASNGTVSLLWTQLSEALWPSRQASWRWAVEQTVPPTNLRNKGGDDRNLALYFVFLPEAEARAAGNANIRRLLDADSARVLIYVWGGAEGQPRIQQSPYLGARGRTIALRPAGTGQAAETIDLAADFRASFGGEPTALVGLAVSSDSDDTNTRVAARISDLMLR